MSDEVRVRCLQCGGWQFLEMQGTTCLGCGSHLGPPVNFAGIRQALHNAADDLESIEVCKKLVPSSTTSKAFTLARTRFLAACEAYIKAFDQTDSTV